MIEITKRTAGRCADHPERPAEYQITAAPGEWDAQRALCQECMISFAANNEVIRAVLLIQSATRE